MRPHLIFALLLAVASCLPVSGQEGWNWEAMDSGTASHLTSISMVPGDFGVVVGADRTVLSWNGQAWNPMEGVAAAGFSESAWLSAVAVINPALVVMGGCYDTNTEDARGLAVWNGTSWWPKIDATGSSGAASVTGIWTDRSGLLLTSRSYATWITRYDGDNAARDLADNIQWSIAYNGGIGPSLLAIDGRDGHSILAVGIGGAAYFSSDDGQTWSDISSETLASGHWYGVTVLDPRQAWICGVQGGIARWDGTDWSVEVVSFQGGMINWNDILALDAANVWAVGSAGAVAHYDGSQWNDVYLPGVGNNHLVSLSYDGTSLWVVGQNGTIFRAVPASPVALRTEARLIAGGGKNDNDGLPHENTSQ